MKKLVSSVVIALCYAPSVFTMESAIVSVKLCQLMAVVSETSPLLNKNEETHKSADACFHITKHQTANPLALSIQLAGENPTPSNNSENACIGFLDLFCCGRCND
ncbi:MAG TPA: hypothetical protein VHO47_02390 [Candidatus Babeliales bacterium]|nr:hypothetical protein [Candidatus Babeliales bacterium]